MSLHHVRLIHGSEPNPSGQRRIGFAIRYIPTYVRQVAGAHDTATWCGAWTASAISNPSSGRTGYARGGLAYHAKVTGAHSEILMRDTGREMRA